MGLQEAVHPPRLLQMDIAGGTWPSRLLQMDIAKGTWTLIVYWEFPILLNHSPYRYSDLSSAWQLRGFANVPVKKWTFHYVLGSRGRVRSKVVIIRQRARLFLELKDTRKSVCQKYESVWKKWIGKSPKECKPSTKICTRQCHLEHGEWDHTTETRKLKIEVQNEISRKPHGADQRP